VYAFLVVSSRDPTLNCRGIWYTLLSPFQAGRTPSAATALS
jgi:hypothetical protein